MIKRTLRRAYGWHVSSIEVMPGWKVNGKAATTGGSAVEHQLPAMRDDQVARDRQPSAHALREALRSLAAVKRRENALLILWRDPGAGIAHRDPDCVALDAGADRD